MHLSAYLYRMKHQKVKPGTTEIGYLQGIEGDEMKRLEKSVDWIGGLTLL